MRPYRKERVGSRVLAIVSEAIAQRMHDPRVAPLTTVTRVEVSGDLLVAKVYLSVMGDEAAEQRTMSALRHATGYLQRLVARELAVRQCPQLRFEIDESVKRARRTMKLLAELHEKDPACGPHEPNAPTFAHPTQASPPGGEAPKDDSEVPSPDASGAPS